MRIGIDASAWTNWRGFGRFTRGIVNGLLAEDRHNEYVLFFDRTYDNCSDVPANARHVVASTSEAQSDAIAVDGHRSFADMWRMTRAVARERLDVFFSPSIDSYFPVLNRSARVVMIHDVMPETIGATMLPSRASRLRRRVKVRTAIAQARLVATGSRYVADQIQRVLGIDGARLAVIPYGVSEQFRPPPSRASVEQEVRVRFGLGARYLLHVGGFGPNKNIVGLLNAFGQLVNQPAFAGTQLVFVGKREGDAVYDEARAIDHRLEQDDLKDRVRFLGFQQDASLVLLYQAAAALLLPSFVEGFGLSAVEAAKCGTPAIVTRVSPLPGLLGDAAMPIEPENTHEIAHAMVRMLTDHRPREAARAIAARFGWNASAHAALATFKRALE